MPIPVLIVDDHADLRKLVRLTLGGGYDVHEAGDGRKALEMVRALRPSLLLLDVSMPGGVDGLDVCRAVRADDALIATRIVMLSARGQQAERDAGIAAGADAYLVKPFSPLALLDLVARLTAGRVSTAST